MSGWFELIENSASEYQFALVTSNGETMLGSGTYATKAAAQNGILSVQINARRDDRFEKKTMGNGRHYFILKAADSQVVGLSHMYATAEARDATIASVKSLVNTARIKDNTSSAPQANPVQNTVTVSLTKTQDVPEENFYSSSKSPMGRARRWLWIGALIGLALVLLMAITKGTMSTFFTVFTFMLIFFLPLDWLMRRQLKPGQALIVLNRESIESPIFSGKTKHFAWSEIAGVTVESNGNAQYLQFQLAPSPLRPDKRTMWNGVNPTKPRILLNPFEPEEQENVLEALNRRLQQYGAQTGTAPRTLINTIVEEREFHEKLKSLTPTPWITYLIIAINVLVWLITVANGASIQSAPTDKLLLWGGNAASEVQKGEWWRLLTAMFLHSGIMHVAMNMLGLYSVGVMVERIYGHRLYILLYLGSGLIGSALSVSFSAQHAVSVGASGAVFGIAGALLVGLFQHKEDLPKAFGKQTMTNIGIFIVYSLVQGFSKQGIDNAAHIGGLLGGCLLAFILPERFNMEHYMRNLKSRAIAGVFVVFVATTGLAAIAPHSTLDQKKLIESQNAVLHGIAAFDSACKKLQQEQLDVKAGKLTAIESDGRNKTVYAPMFRNVLHELSQITLSPTDPLLTFLQESTRMTELLIESLEMRIVFRNGLDNPEPADPARMAAINEELKAIGDRVFQIAKDAKAKRR
jgi:rhomboid protease GluP